MLESRGDLLSAFSSQGEVKPSESVAFGVKQVLIAVLDISGVGTLLDGSNLEEPPSKC